MNLFLARSDSGFEIIFGVIVFIIWVISALAGKLKNSANQRTMPGQPPQPTGIDRLQQEIAEQLRRMQGGPVARPMPAPPPVPTARQPQQKVRQQQRKVKPPRIPQMPVQAPPLPVRRPSAPVVSSVPERAVAPTVAAPEIRRWLRPATLKQQFILTELFQPPLSMRQRE